MVIVGLQVTVSRILLLNPKPRLGWKRIPLKLRVPVVFYYWRYNSVVLGSSSAIIDPGILVMILWILLFLEMPSSTLSDNPLFAQLQFLLHKLSTFSHILFLNLSQKLFSGAI